jgi:hypothetical protein
MSEAPEGLHSDERRLAAILAADVAFRGLESTMTILGQNVLPGAPTCLTSTLFGVAPLDVSGPGHFVDRLDPPIARARGSGNEFERHAEFWRSGLVCRGDPPGHCKLGGNASRANDRPSSPRRTLSRASMNRRTTSSALPSLYRSATESARSPPDPQNQVAERFPARRMGARRSTTAASSQQPFSLRV